jgi:hypothetical protein
MGDNDSEMTDVAGTAAPELITPSMISDTLTASADPAEHTTTLPPSETRFVTGE